LIDNLCGKYETALSREVSPADACDLPRQFGCRSAQLAAMGEQPILKNTEHPIYRLLFLRAFGQPACVRLDINPDGTATLLEKEGWNVKDDAIATTEIPVDPNLAVTKKTLSSAQTKVFLETFNNSGFWQMPSEDPAGGQMENDGPVCLVEAVNKRVYHVIERCSPYLPCSKVLLQLGDVDPEPYMAALTRKIRDAWSPPKGHEDNLVIVIFHVQRNGAVSNLQVKESSGILSDDAAPSGNQKCCTIQACSVPS
jgi:TonB C terminal